MNKAERYMFDWAKVGNVWRVRRGGQTKERHPNACMKQVGSSQATEREKKTGREEGTEELLKADKLISPPSGGP
jgi:hypothetical protein